MGPGTTHSAQVWAEPATFQRLGQAMNKVANKNCRVGVVGNPCNTNCLILAHNAPDIPTQNFTAMTRLDHDRGVSVLSQKTMLPPNEINYFAMLSNQPSPPWH